MMIKTIYRKLIEKKNGTHISRNAKIYPKVVFEGKNFIAKNTVLYHCSFGIMSYISNDCSLINTTVGRYTSIGPNCHIFCGNHPTSNFVSTHPAFYKSGRIEGPCFVNKNKFEEFDYVDKDNEIMCSIGNDVWIASNVSIKTGVSIGDGAIVAAGAVVVKDVPPYSIVGGVPAKVIKYRFNKNQIEWLQSVQWWNKNEAWIKEHADEFDSIDILMNAVDKDTEAT